MKDTAPGNTVLAVLAGANGGIPVGSTDEGGSFPLPNQGAGPQPVPKRAPRKPAPPQPLKRTNFQPVERPKDDLKGQVAQVVLPKGLLPPAKPVFRPSPAPVAPAARVNDTRDIAICLPFYKTTNPHTTFSLLSMFDRSKMGLKMQVGDAMVAHSRNYIADWFLKSRFAWSLWVDDDMILPTGDVGWFKSVTGFDKMDDVTAGRNTVDRLRESGRTFVGATYFGRNPHGKAMFAEAFNSDRVSAEVRKAPRNEVRATNWVGTGCCLIHRSVFEAIQHKFPELAPPAPTDVWQFFSPSQDEVFRAANELEKLTEPDEIKLAAARLSNLARKYHPGTGEDVIFGRRALISGHQPHVDLGLVVGHMGTAVYGPQNTR